jgi:hypothetical protein
MKGGLWTTEVSGTTMVCLRDIYTPERELVFILVLRFAERKG